MICLKITFDIINFTKIRLVTSAILRNNCRSRAEPPSQPSLQYRTWGNGRRGAPKQWAIDAPVSRAPWQWGSLEERRLGARSLYKEEVSNNLAIAPIHPTTSTCL